MFTVLRRLLFYGYIGYYVGTSFANIGRRPVSTIPPARPQSTKTAAKKVVVKQKVGPPPPESADAPPLP